MCESSKRVDPRIELDVKYNQLECDRQDARTSKIYETFNLPHRFECPYMFRGYGLQRPGQSVFYKTVNSEYGWHPPNPHTVPHRFFPRSQAFSTELARSGMYRNYSLNTAMDKSFY